jgi:hypothetical protein
MFCPHCGKENASPFALCAGCGKPLATVQAGSVPTAAAPPPMAALPRKKSTGPLIAVIAVVLLALISAGAYLVSHVNTETADQHIGRLMREATGAQPIQEKGFARDRKFDDAFRDQFRKLIQINQEYSSASEKLDTSAIGKLNTPESFADPMTGSLALQQIHAAFDLDAAQEKKVKEILGDLRRTLETNTWSESDRVSALKGFDQGVAQQTPIRERLITTEKAWVDSLDDMYGYAGQNYSVFTVADGHLRISNSSVLMEFNTRLHLEESRRMAFVGAKKAFDQFQANLLNRMGVSQKDVGIPGDH